MFTLLTFPVVLNLLSLSIQSSSEGAALITTLASPVFTMEGQERDYPQPRGSSEDGGNGVDPRGHQPSVSSPAGRQLLTPHGYFQWLASLDENERGSRSVFFSSSEMVHFAFLPMAKEAADGFK